MPRGWKLQWAPTTMETAEAAQAFEYFRMDEHVVLLYTNRAHELFSEADDRFVRTLTPDEVEWLCGCIDSTVVKKASRNPRKAFENDQAFMAAFERELAIEKQRLEGKEDAGNGDGTET